MVLTLPTGPALNVTSVAKILPEMSAAFFSYMDEELMELVRNAKSNAQQSEYFSAMTGLEQAR